MNARYLGYAVSGFGSSVDMLGAHLGSLKRDNSALGRDMKFALEEIGFGLKTKIPEGIEWPIGKNIPKPAPTKMDLSSK